MKTYLSLFIIFVFAQISISSAAFCPDAPSNDSPCITNSNPPIDLTDVYNHTGSTCCATQDLGNLVCSPASEGASVWYVYTPNEADVGYNIILESIDIEGPTALEVYSGLPDAGCTGELTVIASSCNSNNTEIKFGNCFSTGDVIFVKVTTGELDENCGGFNIIISPAECEPFADSCLDLANTPILQPVTESEFGIDYLCIDGCLDYACPEDSTFGGCPEFTEMPVVWYHVITDDIASQMFTTIVPNGNWSAIWSIYSGPDCDNLSVVDFGGSPPCSNGDATPDLHQTSVFDDEENYWIMVTIDPNSLPATGLDDGSFQLCVSTTINAIICLGELEGGACDDESLVIEITERDNADLSLDGPFCPGEEVDVHVSFFYDASESGADWFIGMVPMFGKGWDMENFDYNSFAPIGNGMQGLWYEEGTSLAPIIQEPVPILCTYRDADGVLQLCNQLCSPCTECEQLGMLEGDPLPSGYFWITNGGNAGCDNDGSPGEGWGIGSVQTQIDWDFKLKVKEFESLEDCFDENSLSISFQTFSDGVAGCWEDPVGECLLDRAMFGPAWTIGCTELPPAVIAEDIEICTKQVADIALNTADGSMLTIKVKAIDNLFISGANDYEFEDGVGVITDFLVNNSKEDQILQYEVYSIDSTLTCNGPKTVVDVLVRNQYIENLEELVCACENGCAEIGLESENFESYFWSTGEFTPLITVCPTEPTSYSVTATDAFGCEHYGDILVDCQGISQDCIEPIYYKLITDYFIDVNKDGIRDSLDLPFDQGGFFLVPEFTLFYNTNPGEDTLLVEEGEYTLSFIQGNIDEFTLTTDSIVTVMFDSINNCVKVEFGLGINDFIRDISLQYNLFHRCNSSRVLSLFLQNNGTKTESGTIWAELDEAIVPDFIATSPLIDTFIAPNIIGWHFENLFPGMKINNYVNVEIPGPPDYPVGWVVNHKLYVEVDNLDGSTENWAEKNINAPILCSYDPNDKAVEPGHEEGYTNIDEEDLVFKIRFQNTGNAPAENIEIRDTLSEFLDLASIDYIGGSHDQYLTFSRVEDRVLVFKFNNIYLPDSTADLEGSQGFLIYKISLNDDLPEGTLIENTAHIYFDKNPAVVTNTTKNILYPDLDGDGFFSVEDCNEDNAEINPEAEEIPNNDVDEDCDGEALIIDVDMDGFNSNEDCDDDNPDINPDAEEIPNNDVDEDCDNLVVIIDVDMDGFNSDEDCDDDNFDINPDAEEIPNNNVDEDCDGEAVIIDVDMDGFNSDEDCNDDNADINPDAEDIPNNGIDEDCDGMDAVLISVEEHYFGEVQIHPNPSNDDFNISFDSEIEVNYIIRDVVGRIIKEGKISGKTGYIQLGEQSNGIYLVAFYSPDRKYSAFYKLLKI